MFLKEEDISSHEAFLHTPLEASSCDVRMSKKANKRRRVNSSDSESDAEDAGAWECTVCTYRNRFESFKCEMCDSRKGTSTRKPRLTSSVVEQQAQVEKALEAAKTKAEHRELREREHSGSGRHSAASGSGAASASAGGGGHAAPHSRSAKSAAAASIARGARDDSMTPPPATAPSTSAAGSSGGSGHRPVHSNSNSRAATTTPTHPTSNNNNNTSRAASPSSTTHSTASPKPEVKSTKHRHDSVASQQQQQQQQQHASTSHSQQQPQQHPPLPAAAKLKNVDRQSARTIAVTVNGMTIVVTDYKLKQRKPYTKRSTESGKESGANKRERKHSLNGTSTTSTPDGKLKHHELQVDTSSTSTPVTGAADNNATSVTPPALDHSFNQRQFV